MLAGRGRVLALLRLRTSRDLAGLSRFAVIASETARVEAVLASKHHEISTCRRWFGTGEGLVSVIGVSHLTNHRSSPASDVLCGLHSHGYSTAAAAAAAANSSSLRASTSTGEGGKRWRFSMIFLFLPCLTTFGLGSWQLIRRQTKIETLDYKRKRLEEEPVPLGEIVGATKTGATVDDLEYRKVICQGVYDGSKSVLVGPRARSAFGVTQKGYYLITPLIGGHGDNSVQVPVLVNRGWVPSGYIDESPNKAATFEDTPDIEVPNIKVDQGSWWKSWFKTSKNEKNDEELQSLPKHQARMTICGVIRSSEQPNMFVPSNAPESGQWFYVDVPAMSRAVGLPEDTILLEAVQDSRNSNWKDKYPIPKDPEALLHASVMPQDHINYALTWYTLSAATTYMAVKRVRNSRRGF
ncbi:surfeit locus 1 family protein [Marchantia polymorpha subsp. ruderalis]|uniref:SURF1-like protein n=2 Tax=Marchantia polymorpha TaxID=3197 RepID=A0A176WP36_MARPO|nr:hypothetical protein AXG93_400s1050 [Marchantia polymorpha subsp. ruderalis]PTQ32902.1 hypothetical protein MARPO_0094s0071 [Marchantia polymorpha]PTQ32903.1 hypothetical protein MARPO_0094s0071 [Marchantia polymorpha]PTQ32904.1 hypothetical protein MARPO_0094s0071 [Marchantia polymorpha]BBN02775.1 hypothetical protein Mp_2g18030 [Marchantia polymorpha subsp. ruderalis]|eukprot:PTQ32902.1 hypothetical protein MARPO_0094s0071 [Marchantia polymorpha]